MISQWLNLINYLIAALTACLLIAASLFWLNRPADIAQGDLKPNHSRLPKGAFELTADAYKQMENPLLALQCAPPTLQIPDLKTQLIYYGKNGRPDAQTVNTSFHFSMNGSKNVVSIAPNEHLYLTYDKKSSPCHYVFSPDNEKTSLWITATPTSGTEIAVKVFMENEKGELITEPKSNAEFKLPEKEFIRYAGAAWEIGTWRVDGTLLARMRARWYGPDRFLEKHGGAEYAKMASKQRVDFGEGDDIYSVFIELGDCLTWDPDETKWQVIKPGADSLKHPLLVVKKIEDRLMGFELWDVEGKGKITLNMLKSTEPAMMAGVQNIQHLFKFVGARTKSQFVFEVNNERMVLRPSDWLFLTPKGWKKLTTAEEIDDYVSRRVSGALFVFEGLTRKEERQFLLGMLYNTSRCDSQEIELPLIPAGNQGNKPIETKDKDKNVAEALKEKLRSQVRSEGELAVPPIPPAVPQQQMNKHSPARI